MDLKTFIDRWRPEIEATLERLLPPAEEPPERVHAAMRYSVLAGGKRLRPLLALIAGRAGEPPWEPLLEPAAALELLHSYSLIHDDLPCMDDDDMRRGQPSCHVRFDEATAVLAGDALLTLCFEVLARYPDELRYAPLKPQAIALVARAAGSLGMVGGQAGDLASQGRDDGDEPRLRWIHERKTAALITASLELGGSLAGVPPRGLERLSAYGQALGLAFQVVDDILDVECSSEQLGKSAGKDERQGKLTYPALIGLEASHRRARELVAEARELADELGEATPLLRELAGLVLERRS